MSERHMRHLKQFNSSENRVTEAAAGRTCDSWRLSRYLVWTQIWNQSQRDEWQSEQNSDLKCFPSCRLRSDSCLSSEECAAMFEEAAEAERSSAAANRTGFIMWREIPWIFVVKADLCEEARRRRRRRFCWWLKLNWTSETNSWMFKL